MFCKRCNFPLEGLKAAVCPECGNSFNPLNPTTYAKRPARFMLRNWRWLLLLSLTAWSLFVSWGMWATWFAAWIEIGQMPGPYNPMPPLAIELGYSLLALLGGFGIVPVLGIAWLTVSSRQRAKDDARFALLFRWAFTLLALCVVSAAISFFWQMFTNWPIHEWWNPT